MLRIRSTIVGLAVVGLAAFGAAPAHANGVVVARLDLTISLPADPCFGCFAEVTGTMDLSDDSAGAILVYAALLTGARLDGSVIYDASCGAGNANGGVRVSSGLTGGALVAGTSASGASIVFPSDMGLGVQWIGNTGTVSIGGQYNVRGGGNIVVVHFSAAGPAVVTETYDAPSTCTDPDNPNPGPATVRVTGVAVGVSG